MWCWLRTLMFRGAAGPPALRSIVVPDGDPYRDHPAGPPRERTSDPHTLDEVLGGLRDAGLDARARRRGFDLTAGSRVMPVRVRDTARVVPEHMACGTDAPELLLDLALALVPLFGPLLADVRYAGAIIVDGKRDRAVLGEDAADRVQQFGRRVARRSPISFPILLDLARRLRQHRS